MRKIILSLLLSFISQASMAATITDHFFTSRDGVHLHYLEAGQGEQTIVFIPGWLMPAAVFRLQLETLGKDFRVLAFDPRSQGKSEIFHGEHSVSKRMDDMEDFLSAAKVREFVLAGWSLGVLESLDFIQRKPQAGLRGLILIDNSIGEGTPPAARSNKFFDDMRDTERRQRYLTEFCTGIFKSTAPEDISQAVLSSALQVPASAAIKLISQPYPRTYWRDIVAGFPRPVLYIIRPRFNEQGEALKHRKGTLAQVEVFPDAGHAMFVDEPALFNSITAAFVTHSFTFVQGSTKPAAQSASTSTLSSSDN
jgi:non-heme chloroperoxidase